ncbi:hypothetical protein KI387_002926, partial [Taxus chinensis]
TKGREGRAGHEKVKRGKSGTAGKKVHKGCGSARFGASQSISGGSEKFVP